jgi:PqqD family protein of HPr-rel-A system
VPVGAEVVVMSIGSEARYFGLRGGAARMWQLIQESPHTVDEIVAAMLAEFDVDEAALRQDVEATLSGLEARGLVRFS